MNLNGMLPNELHHIAIVSEASTGSEAQVRDGSDTPWPKANLVPFDISLCISKNDLPDL